jgi:hypothetical protein
MMETLTTGRRGLTARKAMIHAMYKVKGRWEPGEDAVSKDALCSYEYALNVVKGPWEKGEKEISSNANYACLYAQDVIKGRWERGEETIGQSTFFMNIYAQILGGRLPDHLHARMVLATPDEWTRQYMKRIGQTDANPPAASEQP